MSTLIALRHGESVWNAENRFTGWADVDLTRRGEVEATQAGRLMAMHGIFPDVAHTSVLTRAVRSAAITLDALDRAWLPVRRSWRLNERHYGTLQGLNKRETTARFGPEQVARWRRGYDVSPPALDGDDERSARHDPRYRGLPSELIPTSESLESVLARVLPYWYDAIVSDLATRGCVLVVAHGNSLRALVKHLRRIPDDAIGELNIATGQPWRFELDQHFHLVEDAYLDPAAGLAQAERVRAQADPETDFGDGHDQVRR